MILSIFAGLVFAGWIVSRVATTFAPVGYEDETGFHYGSPRPIIAEPWDPATAHILPQPA